MPPAPLTPDAFWQTFCAATGHSGEYRGVDRFGDTPELADELLALVMSGTKRATCCLARDFAPHNPEAGPPPAPGDHWIIMDGADIPCAIIRTVSATPTPIREVTPEFAFTEGEGDRSLAWWKAAHDAYYTRQGEREGFVYTDSMLGICEAFERVWPVDDTKNPAS